MSKELLTTKPLKFAPEFAKFMPDSIYNEYAANNNNEIIFKKQVS